MEEVEWLKLPQDLQSQFFKRSEEEAERLIKYITALDERLSSLKEVILDKLRHFEPQADRFKVGAVDGSRSPRLSERLGIRYGTFTVGILELEGTKRVKEEFLAGTFHRKQAFSQEVSKYFFDLQMTYNERKAALKIIDEVDFLLVDGSFYGFVYPVLRMKKQGLFGDGERELLNKTYDITNSLIDTGKAIGVIKRSHSRVLSGWMLTKNPADRDLATLIDKLILSHLMPPCSILRYEELVGDEPFYVYSQVAHRVQRGLVTENLLEESREAAYMPYKELGLDIERVKKLRRMQVKSFPEAPVCEIEHPSLPADKVESWIGQRGFFNEATGLPIASDIIDSLIGLDPRFTEEFVSEVEARVLEKVRSRGLSSDTVRWFFSLLNPQKNI